MVKTKIIGIILAMGITGSVIYLVTRSNELSDTESQNVAIYDEVTEYKVTFDSNGGSDIESVLVEENDVITKPSDPSRSSYTFITWELDGEEYDFNTSITSDITLVATWKYIYVSSQSTGSTSTDSTEDLEGNTNNEVEEVKYTVTFNSVGGSLVESLEVLEGNVLVLPSSPTKLGYIFTGWLYNGIAYDANAIINSDMTLTATWQKVEYTVTFVVEDEEFTTKIGIDTLYKVIKPQELTKEGYTFLGWYIGNTKFNFDTQINSDITLFAKWEVNIVEIEEIMENLFLENLGYVEDDYNKIIDSIYAKYIEDYENMTDEEKLLITQDVKNTEIIAFFENNNEVLLSMKQLLLDTGELDQVEGTTIKESLIKSLKTILNHNTDLEVGLNHISTLISVTNYTIESLAAYINKYDVTAMPIDDFYEFVNLEVDIELLTYYIEEYAEINYSDDILVKYFSENTSTPNETINEVNLYYEDKNAEERIVKYIQENWYEILYIQYITKEDSQYDIDAFIGSMLDSSIVVDVIKLIESNSLSFDTIKSNIENKNVNNTAELIAMVKSMISASTQEVMVMYSYEEIIETENNEPEEIIYIKESTDEVETSEETDEYLVIDEDIIEELEENLSEFETEEDQEDEMEESNKDTLNLETEPIENSSHLDDILDIEIQNDETMNEETIEETIE